MPICQRHTDANIVKSRDRRSEKNSEHILTCELSKLMMIADHDPNVFLNA